MLLNFGKCKYRTREFCINYNTGDTIIGTTVIANYLVMTINADVIIIIFIIIITVIQVSEQCSIAASRGNNFFWMIRINIAYKEKANYTSVYMRAQTAFESFLSSSDKLDARILLIPSSQCYFDFIACL